MNIHHIAGEHPLHIRTVGQWITLSSQSDAAPRRPVHQATTRGGCGNQAISQRFPRGQRRTVSNAIAPFRAARQGSARTISSSPGRRLAEHRQSWAHSRLRGRQTGGHPRLGAPFPRCREQERETAARLAAAQGVQNPHKWDQTGISQGALGIRPRRRLSC